MNTKIMTFASTLTLILATSAAAQVKMPFVPGRGIPFGTPTITVPGPIANLPPLYMPSPSLNASPAFSVDPVYSKIVFPINPIMPVRDSLPVPRIVPVTPTPGIMPIMPVQFGALSALNTQLAAPAKDVKSADVAASRAKIEKLFDGRKQADDREPVRVGSHVSLPENDLEKEIGAY